MLFLLFIGLPFVELWLLLQIGAQIGGWETLMIVVLTGAIGAALAKREGLRLWGEIQESLARSEVPEESLVSGLLLLVGGVCLVTPGVITDVFGMSMLFAPLRRGLARILRKRFGAQVKTQVMGGMPGPFGAAPGFGGPREGDVIDVEAEFVDAPPADAQDASTVVAPLR